jgi:hypothetical protein
MRSRHSQWRHCSAGVRTQVAHVLTHVLASFLCWPHAGLTLSVLALCGLCVQVTQLLQ